MIGEEQIQRAEEEFTLATRKAFETAKSAERQLEHCTYYARPYDPDKREKALVAYREADYQAESRAWILYLIQERRSLK